jgi:hypothetical protein
MRQIALTQPLLINVVIDINGFPSYIPSKHLDELARHARAPDVGCKPMPSTVWAEVIFHLI